MATYCFSDLHAQYNLWEQIRNYLKPEDTVFCLGDCVDRGECGLEILNEVLATANITLLKGNHEDFIVQIGSELINSEYYPDNMDVWLSNGASNTIAAFEKMSRNEQIKLISKLKKLPTHKEYINKKGDIIYLSHAGRQPETKEREEKLLNGLILNNYIWDRNHLYDKEWLGKENEYCVHGHTPVSYFYEFIRQDLSPNPFKIKIYCEGHKIDIDLGSFKFHKACLLNLDTFEEIYFKDGKYF